MLHPATENHPGEHVSEFLLEVDQIHRGERRDAPCFQNVPSIRRNSLYAFNDQLDGLALPWDVNEGILRRIWTELERGREKRSPVYWLTVARIAEISIILAGAYADGCEFSAAGDLLVNPSKIMIHVKGGRRPVVKRRWEALSEQLNPNGENRGRAIHWIKNNVTIQIMEKALIPDLYERLERSGMMAPWYLNDLQKRMEKTGDVIGFLSAWKVDDAGDLAARMQTTAPETRKFIAASLCNFNNAHFNRLGLDIRKIENGLGDGGRFLHRGVHGREQ